MENTSPPRRVVLAVSGASGAIYAVRCLQMLVASDIEVELIYSNAARRVLAEECDIYFDGDLTVLLPKCRVLMVFDSRHACQPA